VNEVPKKVIETHEMQGEDIAQILEDLFHHIRTCEPCRKKFNEIYECEEESHSGAFCVKL